MRLTRTVLSVAAMAAGILTVLPPASRADDAALDLMKRVRDAAPTTPLFAKGKLTSDRGLIRELELSHKQLNSNVDASYMEVTSPMDLKDTRFLFFDHKTGRDEQFIYVPAAKRVIQVGGQTRKQSFLGSEFYVGDFAQPEIDAFTYSFVGDETVGGRPCKLVQAVPKNLDDALYSKSITAIDPKDLVVMRTELFDDKGKLQKVWTIEKIEKIDGQWTPLRQKIEDVQEKHWSQLEMSDIKYDAQLPDDRFNKSYLMR
jgi:hypothetical protein